MFGYHDNDRCGFDLWSPVDVKHNGCGEANRYNEYHDACHGGAFYDRDEVGNIIPHNAVENRAFSAYAKHMQEVEDVISMIIVIAIIVGGVCFWIFWTGYDLADDMVKKEELTYLTYRLKLDNLYGLKKRGFMYYCENNTNINEVIQEMNDYVTYNSLGGWL